MLDGLDFKMAIDTNKLFNDPAEVNRVECLFDFLSERKAQDDKVTMIELSKPIF